MPACNCMCFGRAERTGGRAPNDDDGDPAEAGSDAERVGCLRIDTGVAITGRAVGGVGADGGGATVGRAGTECIRG